ncbi:hypothetical protein [Streptomyces sp. NPDC001515]
MSEGHLANTGTGAAVTVFGMVIAEMWLLAAAAAIVLTGVILLRLTWRRHRPVGS